MDLLQNQSHRSICRFPARFQGPCPSRNAERRAKGENSIEKRVFLGCSLAQSVILTRARTCPRRLDESTLRPSRTMGCDDASKAALLALSGMTTETGTFPAARFRPAPRFDASARPRQPSPGGGLGAAPPLPSRRLDRRAFRDRAIDRAIARRTGTPRRRSRRAPRAKSEPRHRRFCGLFATFRVAEGCKSGRLRRAVYFLYFSLTSNSSSPLPLSRASQSTTSAASPRNSAPGNPTYRSVITITARSPWTPPLSSRTA